VQWKRVADDRSKNEKLLWFFYAAQSGSIAECRLALPGALDAGTHADAYEDPTPQ